MREGKTLVGLVVTLLFAAAAAGATWNESVNGSLSTDPANPTPFALGLGSNTVTGTLQTPSPGNNRDWIAVTVPPLLQLSQYVHTSYTSADATSFTGFQAGASFAGNPGLAGSYAGYSHFGTAPTNTIGTDRFPDMETAAGATGFTAPLGPGTYTFLIQQTGPSQTAYSFDFVTVPEPASFGMLLLSGVLALTARRRHA